MRQGDVDRHFDAVPLRRELSGYTISARNWHSTAQRRGRSSYPLPPAALDCCRHKLSACVRALTGKAGTFRGEPADKGSQRIIRLAASSRTRLLARSVAAPAYHRQGQEATFDVERFATARQLAACLQLAASRQSWRITPKGGWRGSCRCSCSILLKLSLQMFSLSSSARRFLPSSALSPSSCVLLFALAKAPPGHVPSARACLRTCSAEPPPVLLAQLAVMF
jgi:hypothetical protein